MPNTILKKLFSAPGIPCYTVFSWSPEGSEGTFMPSEVEEPLGHSAMWFSGR